MRKRCDQIKTIESCDLPSNLVKKLINDKELNDKTFYNLYYYFIDENNKDDDDDYELIKYIGDNFEVYYGEVITILISW